MEKIRKLLLSSLCLLSLLSATGCKEKIVVNNAFVYLVHDSCYHYGTISGEQWQSVFVDEYSTEVTAVPKNGYRFIEWSDGLTTSSRKDLAVNDNSNGPVTYYAYFEAIDG